MDMNAIDYGTILAFIALILKQQSDKAQAAEELGKMKQQLVTLETKSAQVDQKFSGIDSKLSHLVASNARLESLVKMLISSKSSTAASLKFLETPTVNG